MKEIIFAGFGGQGVLTVGYLLAKISVASGRQVTWIPAYGSEMRGGTANCSVKISDREIASPFIKDIDILVALNGPSFAKFAGQVRPGGLIVANSSLVTDFSAAGEGVRLAAIPGNEIVGRWENPRGINLVMLGGLAGASDLLPKQAYLDGIEAQFKKYAEMLPKNFGVFEEGFKLAAA